MGIEYTPFRAQHLLYLSPQVQQRREHALIINSNFANIMEDGFGLTAWVDQRCVGMAGCLPVFSHRAVGWAFLSDEAGPYMLRFIRKFREVIDGLPYSRIEISVSDDFEMGHRFARMIGMECETPEPMRKYGPNGEDQHMYAMVR